MIPVIIASDKTQLTLIGNKTAYPVYITIGNLPKRIRSKPSRHGQILLAYLPTSKLEHITNKAARRRTLANLFHACLHRALSPLKSYGGSAKSCVIDTIEDYTSEKSAPSCWNIQESRKHLQ